MRALKWIVAGLLLATQAWAQSYPSPRFQNTTTYNLSVTGGALTGLSTLAGSGTGTYAFNSITVNDGAFSNPSGNSFGFYVQMLGRNAASNGFRFASGSLCQWDTPGDPASTSGHNGCVGVLAQGIANYDNSITPAVGLPSMWGLNSNVVATASAKNWGNIQSIEADTTTSAGADYTSRVGLSLLLNGNGIQASTRDMGVSFLASSTVAHGWACLICFDKLSGGQPIDATGTVLGVISGPAMTIANGIKFDYGLVFTGKPFASPGWYVDGSGNESANALATQTNVSFNKATAPADQHLSEWNTDANGQPRLQARNDALAATTWATFTRTGGAASAIVSSVKLYSAASSATLAGFNIPPGTAPVGTWQDGDLVTTTTSLLYRINGATKTTGNLEDDQTYSGLKTFTQGLVVTPGADPASPTNGQFWANAGAFRGRLGGVSYTFGMLELAQTWTLAQTFSVNPTFSACTGYVKGAGASAVTCSATVPVGDISGLGTGVATFLATPSSANLAAAVTDETGTGALVFAGSPALTGNPTAPTQALNDNSTKLATTAYVDRLAVTTTYAKITVVQVFTSNGTYTPTTGMKIATVYAFGAGGGGGSGARAAAGAATGGGSGGGGGGLAQAWFTAAQIGASQTVTIGTAGTGGAAQTVDATAGVDGTAGTATTLGTLLFAGGGGGGQGGGLAANSGGGGAGGSASSGTSGTGGTGGTGSFGVGSGGSGAIGANGITVVGNGSGGAGSVAAGTVGLAGGSTASLFGGGAGGGSGGGITTGDAASNGGAGGSIFVGGSNVRGAAGTVGAGQAGGNGSTFANSGGPINQAAASGGGGASNTGAAAGAGGNGGLGGGAGAGGGASRNGFASGKGGDGGAGLMIIVEQF